MAYCIVHDVCQVTGFNNLPGITIGLCSVHAIILRERTLEDRRKLVIVLYGKFFNWKRLHNKYPLLSNVFSHPSYMPWRYIMSTKFNQSTKANQARGIIHKLMSSQTLWGYPGTIQFAYTFKMQWNKTKRPHWGLTTCEKLCKKITCPQKTTERHERNVTCVLEPNYNLAHAPLNLTVIWLICWL